MTSPYRTFREQSRHYFARPHHGLPTQPIQSPAAWLGEQQRKQTDHWLIELSQQDIDTIDRATEYVMQSGTPTERITHGDFPLPGLAQKIANWRATLADGRGFCVVRGLPVDAWGETKSGVAFWGIGHHLGAPGAQNPQGDLLGHVIDYGEEKSQPNVRRYRTTGNIDFHCDAADVVGLLCLNAAKVGGQSRIASSVSVFNQVLMSMPEAVGRLFEPFALDLRDEQGPRQRGYMPVQPCCFGADGKLRTFYHSEYFRSAQRLEGVQIDPIAMQLLDAYDEFCASDKVYLDMWLAPGDMQFVSNHTTMHARTGYEDWPEPERRRHLLRLWLSL